VGEGINVTHPYRAIHQLPRERRVSLSLQEAEEERVLGLIYMLSGNGLVAG
jgi:hypothetical protein